MFLLLLFFLPSISPCTTFLAGSRATLDGSTLVSHSDDGLTDPRLFYVPAADFLLPAFRPVFFDVEEYPRYVGTDRGPGYRPEKGETPSRPIGFIPQVAHTYARYGIGKECGEIDMRLRMGL